MKLTHAARKNKAKRLQKLVASMISEHTGLDMGKDCPIESRQMGEAGPDVRLDNEARKLFPFTVECKNKEKWDLADAIEQAKANCYPETDWLLVLSRNRFDPVAVIDLTVFFKLLLNKYQPPRKLKK